MGSPQDSPAEIPGATLIPPFPEHWFFWFSQFFNKLEFFPVACRTEPKLTLSTTLWKRSSGPKILQKERGFLRNGSLTPDLDWRIWTVHGDLNSWLWQEAPVRYATHEDLTGFQWRSILIQSHAEALYLMSVKLFFLVDHKKNPSGINIFPGPKNINRGLPAFKFTLSDMGVFTSPYRWLREWAPNWKLPDRIVSSLASCSVRIALGKLLFLAFGERPRLEAKTKSDADCYLHFLGTNLLVFQGWKRGREHRWRRETEKRSGAQPPRQPGYAEFPEHHRTLLVLVGFWSSCPCFGEIFYTFSQTPDLFGITQDPRSEVPIPAPLSSASALPQPRAMQGISVLDPTCLGLWHPSALFRFLLCSPYLCFQELNSWPWPLLT